MGLIPGLVRWVQDLMLPQLWLRSRLHLGPDPWPGNAICRGEGKKKKKKKKEEKKKAYSYPV